LKPETARIHGGQEDEVVKSFHISKDMIDFFPAEDTWQAFFRLGFQDLEDVPASSQDVDEKEFQGTVADLEGTGGPPGFSFRRYRK
jgi:hypothetical protein